MKTYFGSTQLDLRYPPKTIVAIGNFDGVHLGHQEILKEAQWLGQSMGCSVTCYTFCPHPTIELRPEAKINLLMTYEEKRLALANHQIDFCVEERFDSDFSKISAEDFFKKILKDRLKAVGIVVGQDFAFGKKREGTLSVLNQYCIDTRTELRIVPQVLIEGEAVSSSRIRKTLALGNVELARKLLGRAFSYSGEVIHGNKRGRTIGFPTANMKCEEKFPLRPGVYATSVIWRGVEYQSVTNIGTQPTFQNSELKIETYILDQNFELYGEILEVRFHSSIRDVQKFASIDELKKQIQTDTILAKARLNAGYF